MKKSISIIFLILLPALLLAQANILTRKYRLEDLSLKTSKIVIQDSQLGKALQEAATSSWIVSAYEFCDEAFLDANKEKTEWYFIYIRTEGDFEWLVMRKGGREKDPDPLKSGFEVVSIPIAPAGGPYDESCVYVSAFVDILQYFIRDARESDKVAYGGLAYYNGTPTHKKPVIHDEAAARQAIEMRMEDSIAEFTVAPGNGGKQGWQYRVGTDDHFPYRFKKVQWKKR